MENKGLWAKINEAPVLEQKPFKLEDLKEIFEQWKSQPYKKPTLTLPCDDYSTFTDKEFINFIEECKNSEDYNYKFIGGSEGYKKMKDRMTKLNIKLD